ncbi:MAG TPA: DNA polymerase III subunit gamma/tau [Rhodospirillaceae bacterium]|nr:MAG: DNA polymerase III subunit gamma/tau [Alphaproteobacteria bacterium GWF2_58_20]HAU29637.1 DNA polymerase III subunit gamma/tau [Rhodospirillaceae bacterium]
MTEAYRVLARKYRPQTFADLIGQQALVRTLSNAMETGRIAHAFMLTGVRGVGKTSTARIIARGLNCTGNGNTGPTITPCGTCDSCLSIAQDRHVDILEMDAASNTGVDDIRQIIDSVRYAPVSARYKVYIIDEVHMLSKAAFNALLKTLEEPPEHAKFIFATTEIRKVPVTILSRCQRFDLRRVDISELITHFTRIAALEKAPADAEAIALIARAADGSVRDGLSLLDQAMALGSGKIDLGQVQDMLGLADRTVVFDLMEAAVKGQAQDALSIMEALHKSGADPLVVLQDLLDLSHFLTRMKLVPALATSTSLPEAERVQGKVLSENLSMASLTRLWQILLKGIGEVQSAPQPQQAAEMVLIRLVYAADMPSPADLVRQLQSGGHASTGSTEGGTPTPSAPMQMSSSMPPPVQGAPTASASPKASAPMAILRQNTSTAPAPVLAPPPSAPTDMPSPALDSFEKVVGIFAEKREMLIWGHLRSSAHLVKFEPGHIELRLDPDAPNDLAGNVAKYLNEWTGRRWIVAISTTAGENTLSQKESDQKALAMADAEKHPLVQAVMLAFPGTKLAALHDIAAEMVSQNAEDASETSEAMPAMEYDTLSDPEGE